MYVVTSAEYWLSTMYMRRQLWLVGGLRVVVKEMIGESLEESWLLGAEETVVDLINGLLELWVTLIVLVRVVPTYVHSHATQSQ